MDRKDWLLLLLDEELDPIRIQKGMFLFAKESGARDRELYEFVPYNWGPCSFDIYDDLDSLHRDGLIERRPVPGKSWYKYQISPAGRDFTSTLRLPKGDSLDYLGKIKSAITRASFNRLLDNVYKRYPEYAINSHYRG